MTVESVKQRCMKNHPYIDEKLLDEDIEKQMTRFERIVRTTFNESNKGGVFSKTYHENPTAVRNDFFEKHKLEYVRQHLSMLVDLYDWNDHGQEAAD